MKRRTKQIFISGIIGIFLIALTMYLKYRIEGMRTYKDPQHRFTIHYPKKWEVRQKTAGADVLFLSPRDGDLDLFRENVSVIVQPLDAQKPHSLSDYSYKAVNQVTTVFGINLKVLENNPLAELDGRAAHRFSFIGRGQEGSYKYLMVWTINKAQTKAYQITYAAILAQFDRYEPQVEKMLQSFKIKDDQ